MMRITLEIIPKGDEASKFTAGILTISNDCTGKYPEIGNYDFRITGPEFEGGMDCFWGNGRLEDFKRKRGWWSCVKACLNNFNTDYWDQDVQLIKVLPANGGGL